MLRKENSAVKLDTATLAGLRARLEAERRKLQETIQALATEGGASQLEASASHDPEDFSEMARDITERDTELALTANDQRLLAQVEHALRRMDQGHYGVSEVSGAPIPLERLEAIPWATTTVDDPVERG